MISRAAASYVNHCGNVTEYDNSHCQHTTWPLEDSMHHSCQLTYQSTNHSMPQQSNYCPCTVGLRAYITSPSTCCYLASHPHNVSCGNQSQHFPNCGNIQQSFQCSHTHSAFTPVVHSHFDPPNSYLCHAAVATVQTTIPQVYPLYEDTNCHCATCRVTSNHENIHNVEHIHRREHQPCGSCEFERVNHARNVYSNVHQHRTHRRMCRSHRYTQAPLPEANWFPLPQQCTPYTYLTVPVPVYAGLQFAAEPSGLLTRSTLAPIPSLSVQVEFHDASSLATQDSFTIEGLDKDEIENLPTYVLEKDMKIDKHCVICLSNYSKGDTLKSLPCRHDYHRECVDKWLETSGTCPICRASVLTNDQLEIESI